MYYGITKNYTGRFIMYYGITKNYTVRFIMYHGITENYTGCFIMYYGITKIYYRKTVGHVFTKPVQREGKAQISSPVRCFSP